MKSLRIKDCIDFLLEGVLMYLIMCSFVDICDKLTLDNCWEWLCLAAFLQFCVAYVAIHIRKIFNKKSQRFLIAGVYTFIVVGAFSVALRRKFIDNGEWELDYDQAFVVLFFVMLPAWFIIRYEIFQYNNNNKVDKTDTDA